MPESGTGVLVKATEVGWPAETGNARTQGTFTVSSGGIADVASYEYWTDWDPTVRSAWVCALYGIPSVVAAYLIFLRRDVAG